MIRTSMMVFLSLLMSSRSFSQTDANADTTKQFFEKVEIEATFPGGEKAWRKLLEKNLNPNVPVENGAPLGQYLVAIQFTVKKTGHVSDIRPLTNQGYGMEQEVIRVLSKADNIWSPAKQNGKPLNAYRKQSFTFMVAKDGFDIFSKTPYVLYTNTDNELTVKVKKLKEENLEATISEGSITNKGDGKFIARVSKPGRVLITVYNRKKENKKLEVISFDVLQPPSPSSGIK